MSVEEELARLSPDKDMVLTIGVFDGVHRGHKYLISQVTGLARTKDQLSGVITFSQHPQEVLSPQSRLPFLTDLTTRIRLLENEGVDVVIVLSFTHEFAQLSARDFISMVKKYLRMNSLVIGPDFALGQNREGNIDFLKKLGREIGFDVTVVQPLTVNGEVASSTSIRNALANGDMKRATYLLGRPFSLHGKVTTGVGRGVQLGFPTANLEVNSKQALPADGVYATWSHFNDSTYQSMTNIGLRPTFGSNERTVEIFILNYQGDLYGNEMGIDIVERLRGEKRFDTAEELKKQIAQDVKQGTSILDSQG